MEAPVLVILNSKHPLELFLIKTAFMHVIDFHMLNTPKSLSDWGFIMDRFEVIKKKSRRSQFSLFFYSPYSLFSYFLNICC